MIDWLRDERRPWTAWFEGVGDSAWATGALGAGLGFSFVLSLLLRGSEAGNAFIYFQF